MTSFVLCLSTPLTSFAAGRLSHTVGIELSESDRERKYGKERKGGGNRKGEAAEAHSLVISVQGSAAAGPN